MSHAGRRFVAGGAAVLTGLAGPALVPSPAQADHPGGRYNVKTPTSRGFGGAVTSVDPEASRIGVEVLRRGGNAVDAAVATAAALGVTEPFSSGIGGGGYFVHYDARTGRVSTLDGRETAPRAMPRERVSSTRAPGSPTGSRRSWSPAVSLSAYRARSPRGSGRCAPWGTSSLAKALRPATRLARRGFVVDQTFNEQTADNRQRFETFPASRRLFLPGGKPRPVGSVFRNRDLADDLPADRPARRPGLLPGGAGPTGRPDRSAPAEAAPRRPAGPAAGISSAATSRATGSSGKAPRTSATAGSTSTAWPPPPAEGRPSVRR